MKIPSWRLGPGLISGIADDDPSALTVFTIAGATLGHRLLWIWLLTLPMGIAVQTICARLGLVTGKGLTAVFVQRWGRRRVAPVVALLVASCVLSIGADIGAIAAVGELLTGLRPYVLIPVVSAAVMLIEVRGSYRRFARLLRWGSLVTFLYIAGAVAARPDLREAAFASITPQIRFDREFIGIVVALVGALLSPYIFFWQTNEESEEHAAPPVGVPLSRGESLQRMQIDVAAGMFAANVIYYFVALTAASALFRHGVTSIATVRDAADALRPLAGDGAYLLFAVGIIVSGLVAIPVLAGTAAYAVAELVGWSEGLSRPFRQARAFYLVIIASTTLGIALNIVGLPAVPTLFVAAIVNGLLVPVVLTLIMLVSTSGDGDLRPSLPTLVVGWAATGLTVVSAGAFALFLR